MLAAALSMLEIQPVHFGTAKYFLFGMILDADIFASLQQGGSTSRGPCLELERAGGLCGVHICRRVIVGCILNPSASFHWFRAPERGTAPVPAF